jgi:hypothetical protein
MSLKLRQKSDLNIVYTQHSIPREDRITSQR